MGGWTSPTDNLSYYMIWCRRSRFTDLRECTRYSPRRSVITKSYSFEGFVRILSLVDPVLQRGHPGREYAREWGAEWAGLPFAPLQAWAGRVCQVPSPHQEGVYFTTVRKNPVRGGTSYVDNRIFSCEEAALEVPKCLCHQVKTIMFPKVQARFRDNLGKVFESFLMSSSQELRSACCFYCLFNNIFLDLGILRWRK